MPSPARPIDFIRERFRFTLGPTLFTIPALAVLIGLGTWQVQRLHWKTALIADRTAALSAPAVPAPDTHDPPRGLDFHHVALSGSFDHVKELYIAALDSRGIAGFQIVTPLTLASGDIVLINRGFVPDSRKKPETRIEGQVSGTIEVDGILRLADKPKGWILPRNQPDSNFWIYVDIPDMVAAARLDPARVLPYYIEAGGSPNPGGFPIGGQTRISLPNDHLQYAITWYGFALTLLIIYFTYHYRKPAA